MKILLVADEESKYLWDYYQPGKLAGIDFMLSCGDLKQEYLEFLVTMGGKPLYYIHGNHDKGYENFPPEGCDCIEDEVVNLHGIRVLGLGGCIRYNPGPYQYTEQEMEKRVKRVEKNLGAQIFDRSTIPLTVTPAGAYYIKAIGKWQCDILPKKGLASC